MDTDVPATERVLHDRCLPTVYTTLLIWKVKLSSSVCHFLDEEDVSRVHYQLTLPDLTLLVPTGYMGTVKECIIRAKILANIKLKIYTLYIPILLDKNTIVKMP